MNSSDAKMTYSEASEPLDALIRQKMHGLPCT